MSNTPALVELKDAELDHVAAAGGFTLVAFAKIKQTNVSYQSSLNVLAIGSGNQVAYQSNSIG